MAFQYYQNNRPNNNATKKQIRCIQINLKHSRVATDTLLKQIEQDGIDVALIQEPYSISNKVAIISNRYRTFSSGQGRIRAAVIVTNNRIDALLIKELSNEDTVVLELIIGSCRYIVASMYLDIKEQLDKDLEKMDKIMLFAKGVGLLFAMDSNSRSTTWHDRMTNTRGRILEEYIFNKNLYIMNEESELTTFQSRTGSSNIDLTVVNNRMTSAFSGWEIRNEESCSDHNFISYSIG